MGNCCPCGSSSKSIPLESGTKKSEKKTQPRPASRWIFSDGIEGAESVKTDIEAEYDIGEQLGQPGQFGVAFVCTPKNGDAVYAVKKIEKARFIDAQADCSAEDRATYYQQFRDEIKIMREISHPNLVTLVDVFEEPDSLFLVMEKCDGGELFDRIKLKKRYSEKDAAAVLKEFAKGIEAMHKQHIAHCDLKPDNILFLTTAEDSPLKIIDFGMSKHSPPSGDRITGFRGTPYYVAPEIVERQAYTFHCDMWSFGVISFVMLFGFPPFHSRSGDDEKIYEKIKEGFYPETRRGFGPWFPEKQKISDSAKDLISRCLESDPIKRYTATEVLEHPWVTGQNASGEPLMDQVMNNLSEFTAGCRLKAAVLEVMTDMLSEAEMANLLKTFKSIDVNDDGQITAEELKSAAEKQVGVSDGETDPDKINEQKAEMKNFEKIIRLADSNGDGKLSYKELVATAVHRKMKLKEERMKQAFQKFDVDGDGHISVDELKELLGADISDKEAEEIIAEVDTDNDGKINEAEFFEMWNKKQEDHQKTYLNSLEEGDDQDNQNLGEKSPLMAQNT